MKNFLLFIAASIAVIVLLCMAGPLVGLAFSGLLIYLGIHYYVKSTSTLSKILWISVGLIGILSAMSNIPALVGIGAILAIYYIYKSWKNESDDVKKISTEDDPFTNFENEWAKITK